MTAESHATDSYQNVLFSLLHFRRKTSSSPTHITIISHEFKRARFLELHIPAIRVCILSNCLFHSYTLFQPRSVFEELLLPKEFSFFDEAFEKSNADIGMAQWPSDKVRFVGIDPPEVVTPRRVLEEGERERGYGKFFSDGLLSA